MSTYSLRRLLGALGMYESQKELADRVADYAKKVRDSIRKIHSIRAQNEKTKALRMFSDLIHQEGVSTLQAICDAKCQGAIPQDFRIAAGGG